MTLEAGLILAHFKTGVSCFGKASLESFWIIGTMGRMASLAALSDGGMDGASRDCGLHFCLHACMALKAGGINFVGQQLGKLRTMRAVTGDTGPGGIDGFMREFDVFTHLVVAAIAKLFDGRIQEVELVAFMRIMAISTLRGLKPFVLIFMAAHRVMASVAESRLLGGELVRDNSAGGIGLMTLGTLV